MEVYGDTLDIIVDVNGHGDFASIVKQCRIQVLNP